LTTDSHSGGTTVDDGVNVTIAVGGIEATTVDGTDDGNKVKSIATTDG